MQNIIQQIPLSKLVPHPDNPNQMTGSTFAKLLRNIERTGRYEPLIVRPFRKRKGRFQIINGHHRFKALKKLGKRKADAIVWDVDDEQTDILLATLNRLSGSDVLAKKVALLKRLTEKMNARQLARLLPKTPGQIKRLIDLKMPNASVKLSSGAFANPLVFFVNEKQQQVIKNALSLANSSFRAERSGVEESIQTVFRPPQQKRGTACPPRDRHAVQTDPSAALGVTAGHRLARTGRVIPTKSTKAAGNAAALTVIAQHFLDTTRPEDEDNED